MYMYMYIYTVAYKGSFRAVLAFLEYCIPIFSGDGVLVRHKWLAMHV